MNENNELQSCSCMGSFFSPQQKWFLIRKPKTEEESPGHIRNRSSELKIEGEGKPQKKSLKKRPNSTSNLIQQTPPNTLPFEVYRPEQELKISFEHQQPRATNQYSFSIIEDLPHSTPRDSHPNSPQYIEQHYPHPIELQHTNKAFTVQTSPYSRPSHDSPHHPQPYSQPILSNNFQNAYNHYQQNTDAYSNPKQNTPSPPPHVQKVHYPIRYTQQETESWIPVPVREELLIEDFQRLFKHRDEHQSQATLNGDHRIGKVREAKRSKRLEKQLIGRFAQSDDEVCSESAPSEVIGKGFDSHFNTFWEDGGGFHFEETMATRSTNTKLSQAQKGEKQGFIKPRFGTDNHFLSYRNL